MKSTILTVSPGAAVNQEKKNEMAKCYRSDTYKIIQIPHSCTTVCVFSSGTCFSPRIGIISEVRLMLVSVSFLLWQLLSYVLGKCSY